MANQIEFSVKVNGTEQVVADVNKVSNSVDNLSKTTDKTAAVKEKIGNLGKGMAESFNGATTAISAGNSGLLGFGNSLSKLPGPLGGVTSSVVSLGKQLWVLLSNPVVAVVSAIVLAFTALWKMLKNFEPVFNAIEQATAAVVGVFNVLKNLVISLVTGAANLKEAFSGLGTRMKIAAEAAIELTQAMEQLEELKDRSSVSNSKLKTEIDQLILQSKNRTSTEEERIALIDKALAKEKELFDQNKAIADEEKRIAEQSIINSAELTAAEIKDLKERGIAAVQDLEERKNITKEQSKALLDAYLKEEELNRESIGLQEKAMNRRDALTDKQAADEQKKLDDAKIAQEKANKLLDEKVEKLQKVADETVEIGESANKSLLSSEKELYDKTSDMMDADMEEFSASVDKQLEDEQRLKEGLSEAADFKVAIMEEGFAKEAEIIQRENAYKLEENQKLYDEGLISKQQYEDNLYAIEEANAKARNDLNRAVLTAQLNATASVLSGVASLFSKNTKAYKIIKSAEVVITTATAAINAFNSMTGIPVVGTALGILAAGVAVAQGVKALSDINKVTVPEGDTSPTPEAKTPPSKFSSGGLVEGQGSSFSDSVNSMLAPGESVINARSTALFGNTLSSINQAGGGVPINTGGNSSPIIKTYVVTSDMTSQLEADKKLKDLARI